MSARVRRDDGLHTIERLTKATAAGAQTTTQPAAGSQAPSSPTALGAGVIGVLPLGACPLSETAHIAAYMQTQGAGQCGPCSNGLPAISAAVANLAWEPRVEAREVARIEELCGQVAGRGACHHPDGVVRLVRTMLRVFPDHVASHLGHGPCDRAGQGPVLPVPVARCWTGG